MMEYAEKVYEDNYLFLICVLECVNIIFIFFAQFRIENFILLDSLKCSAALAGTGWKRLE